MRRAAKVDRNQAEIVKALRSAGCTVQSLAAIGKGCPDILVGYRGRNYLFEIKDPTQPLSKQALKPDQIVWRSNWNGVLGTITSFEQAFSIIKNNP